MCIVRSMNVDFEPREFAREWIAAWNTHDLDAILSHYAEDVVLTSPVATRILNTPSGTVQGKSALREYFKLGLQAYPDLHFDFLDVMHGLSSLVICYMNQNGTKTAEFMELREDGKVVRVVANYSA
jgi:predicted ester cyclase